MRWLHLLIESKSTLMIPSQSFTCFPVGLHPIAANRLSSHAHDMTANPLSRNASQRIVNAQESTAGGNLNHKNPPSEPSPDSIARLAYAIYENQSSQPGHQVEHWLEAEAQLFGGVERETQMHPGSSLFTTEH
jgi:hypothetical protein